MDINNKEDIKRLEAYISKLEKQDGEAIFLDFNVPMEDGDEDEE